MWTDLIIIIIIIIIIILILILIILIITIMIIIMMIMIMMMMVMMMIKNISRSMAQIVAFKYDQMRLYRSTNGQESLEEWKPSKRP